MQYLPIPHSRAGDRKNTYITTKTITKKVENRSAEINAKDLQKNAPTDSAARTSTPIPNTKTESNEKNKRTLQVTDAMKKKIIVIQQSLKSIIQMMTWEDGPLFTYFARELYTDYVAINDIYKLSRIALERPSPPKHPLPAAPSRNDRRFAVGYRQMLQGLITKLEHFDDAEKLGNHEEGIIAQLRKTWSAFCHRLNVHIRPVAKGEEVGLDSTAQISRFVEDSGLQKRGKMLPASKKRKREISSGDSDEAEISSGTARRQKRGYAFNGNHQDGVL